VNCLDEDARDLAVKVNVARAKKQSRRCGTIILRTGGAMRANDVPKDRRPLSPAGQMGSKEWAAPAD